MPEEYKKSTNKPIDGRENPYARRKMQLSLWS
jgi:hypothetical protein